MNAFNWALRTARDIRAGRTTLADARAEGVALGYFDETCPGGKRHWWGRVSERFA